jgi:hypothetical protein
MSNEQRYYDTLKRIAKSYMTPDQIRRDADRGNLCTDSYEEFLEMAYENIQGEARIAIKGKRRPV